MRGSLSFFDLRISSKTEKVVCSLDVKDWGLAATGAEVTSGTEGAVTGGITSFCFEKSSWLGFKDFILSGAFFERKKSAAKDSATRNNKTEMVLVFFKVRKHCFFNIRAVDSI